MLSQQHWKHSPLDSSHRVTVAFKWHLTVPVLNTGSWLVGRGYEVQADLHVSEVTDLREFCSCKMFGL